MLLHCVDRLMLCPGDVCGELCRGWGGVVTVVDGPTLGWSPPPLSTLTPFLTLIPGLILFISCVYGILNWYQIHFHKCNYFVYPFLWQFQFQVYTTKLMKLCAVWVLDIWWTWAHLANCHNLTQTSPGGKSSKQYLVLSLSPVSSPDNMAISKKGFYQAATFADIFSVQF